ncbi:Predicted pyrophosphatase or phosphodiesterase, AlkP superfamily [Arsukibacterium tuosuense]|uniref:Predicted pyrophosphatase or phosphodiesterase, AlkP superfamily n=1 Tax=Arsukibacterium tuosuense TaxID=1323745 RepID=A0A285I287_9GAMM|nr:ectonucleotide pyrophosphatase/phosphodiesterase [Arsukibacterium tuosuense]SNY42054.1 Predicted pyrophosphatase or phosphodiesterase, AlkP superfamily [Arsukibacterium tuosuense]
MKNLIYIILKCLLVTLPLLAVSACSTTGENRHSGAVEPTIILISLDGFSQQYLGEYPAPHIEQLMKEGVVAASMQPAFPTKTFPNHYSIVTGLYPGNHGIIENNIYDADFDAIFRMSKPEEVTDSRWWLGEPIWVTAELQGIKTGTYFYPGSEADIKGVRPSYWQTYDGNITNSERVRSVLQWLALPKAERPAFLTLYFSTIDDAGHRYGPNSEQVKSAVAEVDQAIGQLINGLKQQNLYNKVNLMLVSDHGMAEVPPEQVIVVDSLFDANKAVLTLWTPEIVSIFPKAGELENIYQQLSAGLPASAKVYRKQDLPDRWHYKQSKRVAPLLIIPNPGWRLMQQSQYQRWQARADQQSVAGSHGYDNIAAEMQAIFIGHGPAFAKGKTIPSFANIELYNLMCEILDITPAANDGDLKWTRQLLQLKKQQISQ